MERQKSDIDFTPVIGIKVTEINRMYPIIIFDVGYLTIECSWRFRKANKIIVGQAETEVEDKKDKLYEVLEEMLIGKRVVEVIHYVDISDLTVVFEDGIVIDIFHDSSWYEGWQFQGPNNFLVVSLPGGGFSYWIDSGSRKR